MKTATLLLLLPLASLPALLTGCSKSGSDSGGGSATEAVGADGTRTINLTGNDTLQYNLKEITAAPGEKLHIQLTNIGVMPKQTMSHNFLLLQAMPDAEVNALAMAASTKPPEFLPEDQSKIIARTKMLGPGESETVTFTVPAAPGSYPYLCTFPGHFAVMRGNLVVKAK